MEPNLFILVQEYDVFYGLLGCRAQIADLEPVSRGLTEEIHVAVLGNQRLVGHGYQFRICLVFEGNGDGCVVGRSEISRLVSRLAEEDGAEGRLAVTVSPTVKHSFVRIAGVLARISNLVALFVKLILDVRLLGEVQDELHTVHFTKAILAGLLVDITQDLMDFPVVLTGVHEFFHVFAERSAGIQAEKLDYRGLPIRDNGDALFSVLSCMNHCSYVDLDSTGISESSLEKLRALFPQTKIVWRVWFGENYSVRTDVERILASKPTVGGMIKDASMLRYCTDVKYLDLGHNDDLADLSFVASMPQLEVLIIAMTGITDISPLRNCPRLEYLELNSTNIADLSPLEKLTELHHLNIAACPRIKDIAPLYGLTELERLWIGRDTPVPEEQARHMKELVPTCKVNTTADDPHGDAWRFTDYDPEEPKYYWVPRYELLRKQLGYNYQEYSFYWLDPLCDKEVPDEYRGMFGKEVYGL